MDSKMKFPAFFGAFLVVGTGVFVQASAVIELDRNTNSCVAPIYTISPAAWNTLNPESFKNESCSKAGSQSKSIFDKNPD